jgi:hypothetical protein
MNTQTNDKLTVLSKQIASILKRVGAAESELDIINNASTTDVVTTGKWNDSLTGGAYVTSTTKTISNEVTAIVRTFTGTFAAAPAAIDTVVCPIPTAAATTTVVIGGTSYTATLSIAGLITIADVPTAEEIVIPAFTFTYIRV